MGYFLGFKWDDMPSVGTYEKALEVYNHPKRAKRHDDSTGFRPLRIGDRKKRTAIHMVPNGGIAMRLYETDVVRYNPDGTIYLESYRTKTTQEFADEVLPPGVRMVIEWNTRSERDDTYLCTWDATKGGRWDDTRYYRFDGDTMLIERDPENPELWRPAGADYAPVEFIHVDKSVYAQVRRNYSLRELEDHFTDPNLPKIDWADHIREFHTQELMAWIASKRYDLVQRVYPHNTVQCALRFVYRTTNTHTRTYKDHVTYDELQTACRQQRRWGWV